MKITATSVLALAGAPAASAFVAPTSAFNGASVAAAGARRGMQERVSAVQCQMVSGGRVPFIAGNWKMNPLDLQSAKDLAKQVSVMCAVMRVQPEDLEQCICSKRFGVS